MKRMTTAAISVLLLTGCSTYDFQTLGSLAQGGRPTSIGGGKVDVGTALSAGTDLYKAASLTDTEVKSMALQWSNQYDQSGKVAPASNPYAKRLAALTKNAQEYDGLKLNYKVLLTDDVNACAFADGSIRVNSGLMDKMDDEEVMSIIGHEIGHVKNGDTADKLRVAYAAKAAVKGAASMNNVAGAVASTDVVGGTILEFVNAQFSQSQEEAADDYGLQFMQDTGHNPWAMVRAFNYLAEQEEKAGEDSKEFRFLSSHPAPGARAERLAGMLKEKGVKEDTVFKAKPAAKMAAAEKQADAAAPAGKAETRAAAAGKAVPVDSGKGKYYVQVVAGSNAASVSSLAAEVQAGYPNVFTQSAVVNGAEYTRVLVGPWKNRQTAEAKAKEIQQQKYTSEIPFVKYMP